MYLKNYSDLKSNCYTYLGFKKGITDPKIDLLIDKALEEIEKLHQFKYEYQRFDEVIPILNKEPYLSFLAGSTEYIISCMTLGYNVERRIKMLSKIDMEYMVIFDACASAYLEYMSDNYEHTLYDNPTYRFCPGYGGSSATDLKEIAKIIHPEKIGIELLESNIMIPQKSMIGIVGNKFSSKKSCKNCVNQKHCSYRKKGTLCYN